MPPRATLFLQHENYKYIYRDNILFSNVKITVFFLIIKNNRFNNGLKENVRQTKNIKN